MGKTKALIFDLSSSISFGRLSLLGKVLFPMLVLKSDDQGRGLAEADAIKWKVCPSVAELTTETIEGVLQEMADNRIDLVHLYEDSRGRQLYQFKRWWVPDIGSGSCLQWARPSEYEAPEGWVDRVRIQQGPGKQPYVENWDKQGGFGGTALANGIPNDIPNEPPDDSMGNNITENNSTQNKKHSSPKGDGADAPSPLADYLEMLKAWIELFPDKPMPRESNQTLQRKVATRMKSTHFKQNWYAAMERASKSKFCKDGPWFNFAWFVKNDDHYERCLQGNYDNRGGGNGANKRGSDQVVLQGGYVPRAATEAEFYG